MPDALEGVKAGTKKKGGPFTRGWRTAPHAGYPESGDSLPLFFFPLPPPGLLRPR